MLRRLWRASIWHRDAIPEVERKYGSPLKRVLFPVYDIAVIILGVAGLRIGFQAVERAFPHPAEAVLYAVLTIAGVVCLIGCSFPRLWLQEIVGKFVILFTLGVVMVAMLVAGATLPGHTGFMVAPILIVMMLPPLLRLWILGWEIAARRRKQVIEGVVWSG